MLYHQGVSSPLEQNYPDIENKMIQFISNVCLGTDRFEKKNDHLSSVDIDMKFPCFTVHKKVLYHPNVQEN